MLSLLLAFALTTTACGGDSDSTLSDYDPSRGETFFEEEPTSDSSGDRDSGVDTSSDAEDRFADPQPPATEAPADDYDDSVSAESDEEAMSEGDSALSGADDGFFAPEPSSEDSDGYDEAEEIDVRSADNGIRRFVHTDDDPRSTFALDVDTGSYSIGRRYLEQDQLPPAETVRVEEYVNSFDYDYDDPDERALGISIDGGPSPFDDDNYLVRIGIQAERVGDDDRPAAHLTFVVDTSGSMDRPDRLGLVKESLTLLVDQLDRSDTVAIVTYSDSSGVVLEPTRVRNSDRIIEAIENLRPGGSTNLEAGLRTGYDLASEVFESGDINRVILASDGIANVGQTNPDGLAEMIRRDADRGIQLVTVGYGMDGFNDETMEQIADQGDGFYAYVDTIEEAERIFEDDLTGTLLTVAIDGKIQVEFDEDVVDEYRLIGFENRGVRDSDFRNDDVDAGEIGAGHQVTAIYEVNFARGVDIDDVRDVLGEVNLRWEDPDSGRIIEIDQNIRMRDIEERWFDTDETFRLATVATSFAELLRESPHTGDMEIEQVLAEAELLSDEIRGDDIDQLVELIETAADLY